MKIALVIPLLEYFPPKKYGGIERVVDELSIALEKRGHTITIFGPGEPPLVRKGINYVPCCPKPTLHDQPEKTSFYEINQFLELINKQDEFDIINFHYEPVIARIEVNNWEFNLMNYIHVPMLITFHNNTAVPGNIEYYRSHKELWKHHYSFLSESHRSPLSFLPHSKVIHNGIPVQDFIFSKKPGEYLLFLGRIAHIKGTYEAIQVALKTKKKLIIAAKIDQGDPEYFDKKVKPYIDNKLIVYLGEVGFVEKRKLLSEALCTLCPIPWPEPFGLVGIESLAAGTPVIAFKNGALPELISNGKTGFLVNNVDEMAQKVLQVSKLDRSECRRDAENRFGIKKMCDEYERYYFEIINDKEGNRLPAESRSKQPLSILRHRDMYI